MADELELDETALYGAEAESLHTMDDLSGSEEEPVAHEQPQDTFDFDDLDTNNGASAKDAVANGEASGSARSSTLGMTIPEDAEVSPSPPGAAGSGQGVPRAIYSNNRTGLPAADLADARAAARLGTSAPIAIRSLADRGWRGAGEEDKVKEAPGTFIAPHLLSAQPDWQFSFNGASPLGTAKLQRLRARNAILRSTGFLEPVAEQQKALQAATIGFQENARVRPGGLAAMLSTGGDRPAGSAAPDAPGGVAAPAADQ